MPMGSGPLSAQALLWNAESSGALLKSEEHEVGRTIIKIFW